MRMVFIFFLATVVLMRVQASEASDEVFIAKKNTDLENPFFETISATNACFEFTLNPTFIPFELWIYGLDEQFQEIKYAFVPSRSISTKTTIRIPMLRKVIMGFPGGKSICLQPTFHDKKNGVIRFELEFNSGGNELILSEWELYSSIRTWTREIPENNVFSTETGTSQKNNEVYKKF